MTVRRKTMWILGGFFLIATFFVLLIFGTSYTYVLDVPQTNANSNVNGEAYTVEIEQDKEIVRLTDKSYSDGKLKLTFESVSRGRIFFTVTGPDDYMFMDVIYVHRLNIMTVNSYMGFTRGSRVIPISAVLFLMILLLFNLKEYRDGMSESLYQYKNVRSLSWILFNATLLLNQITVLFSDKALVESLERAMRAATYFAQVAFPFAFVVSVLVCISNIRLMQKEGKNWHNMLGVIMSIAICFGTMLPQFISEWMNNHQTLVDIHNQRAIWPYLEMFVTNLVLIMVSYLECILISTIILTIKAAKKVPAFDKDYILILGCQIRKDGTLTKLLQGRADRALEFARMQKEKTDKDLTFVPSGGQGSDEVMAEASAIRNYLVEQGVPEERILVEDGSCSTKENMQKSHVLISESSRKALPKVAFATTNYHVFRSGILAHDEGLAAEGIGSHTKTYFWVNAFIREFIATLHTERRTHHQVIRALSLSVMLAALLVYLGNAL